jgi:hypothetical protein
LSLVKKAGRGLATRERQEHLSHLDIADRAITRARVNPSSFLGRIHPMNARTQIITGGVALVAIAGVFAFRSQPASLSETKPQLASAAATPVATVGQQPLNDATKQAIAVQDAAVKAAPEVKPVNEGYSFLAKNEELVLNYRVNFDPTKELDKATNAAQKLAKAWRIKELESFQPKSVRIVLVQQDNRKHQKEFGFTSGGEPL